MKTEETKKGNTPNGGVSSTIYYQDSKGNVADKKNATRAEIVEFDKDGLVVGRTYGTLN